jgi:hypothetical protein
LSSPATELTVLSCSDIGEDAVRHLLARYGVAVEWQSAGSPISGSFWGEPEAGIVGQRVFVRPDTPVHSLLHEFCHIICMTPDRRDSLDRDAGGDDLEEAAVCYLQLVLADYLPGVGRGRLMQDMDTWGYSFRLGTTGRWFEDDADDARAWLIDEGLLSSVGEPVFRLRGSD